jgi:hypothetical protein
MSASTFTAPGRFYRGNLHTHSTRSDGGLAPEEVCRRYAERGYDFICLSDHFLPTFDFPITDTRPFRTPAFTTLIGAEVHAPVTSCGEKWHILAVGLPLDFVPTSATETGTELALRCGEAGAFVVIAHPEWYALTLDDAAQIGNAHAVEVYNHTSQVRMSRGGGAYFLDALLSQGRRINALATDDAHFTTQPDPNRDAFGGWVMVKAERNEPELLLEALKAGNYYSTQGPNLEDITVSGHELAVRCSPVSQVMLLGRGRRYSYVAGDNVTTASFGLDLFVGDWCRVVIMDAAGKCAWSNPFYL